MSKKDFLNNCFSPNWLEVDLSEAKNRDVTVNKEVNPESKQRKDLTVLLQELEEIKTNIERAVEKQHRLSNLLGFYTGTIAQ